MLSLRIPAIVLLSTLLAGCMLRPKAAPDTAVTFRGTAVDIPVLVNDTDPRQRDISLVSATASAKGQTRINPDQTIKYIPNIDASGEDVFSYRIRNSRGRTASAEVTVTILEPQPTPLTATPAQTPLIEIVPLDQAGPAEVKRAQPVAETPPPAPQPTPQPAPQPSPRPAPAPAPVVPAAGIALTGVSLTIFTREDDKDSGETVQATIRRGETILAQRTIGGADAWPRQSELTEELEVVPPVPANESGQLTLEVRKVGGLGQGGSWVMQVDVQGRMSDGRTVMLVPRSLPFRYGGGSSNSRTWKLAPVN